MTATATAPAWMSLSAGLLAGGFEGFVTYPAELTKTRSQFAKAQPLDVVRKTWQTAGVRGFYSGCNALVIGNAAKAGVRFLSYDSIKRLFVSKVTGKLTTTGSILSGLGAGAAESLFAVTPSERIKTALIDDARRPQRRYNGLAHATTSIVRAEGLTGLYRGLVPTTLKQSANSAVRFTSYNALVGLVQRVRRSDAKLSSLLTFACGGGAGTITVYATMPFDVVKTRMQSLQERSKYRHSLDCARQIIRDEGAMALWAGSVPRLARLMLSGGLVFTAYENLMGLFGRMST